MAKKWALVLSLCTFLLVGSLVMFFDGTMVFPSIWHALKLALPAAFVIYVCGYYLGKIVSDSKSDSKIVSSTVQKGFVDDLLIPPDALLGNTVSQIAGLPPLDIENDLNDKES